MRYFIELAYNGSRYHGWQTQPNANSVQETIENALTTILREDIKIVGAGRTDAGVHGKKMFAHFDVSSSLDETSMVKKMNSFLPKDIAIYRFIPVAPDAHARFDATLRSYEYHMHTHKNPFLKEGSWYFFHELNFEKMNALTSVLYEYTDFECFSKTHTDVHTFNCKISHAKWIQKGDEWIFEISADRFLRNMVRAIVGTFIDIGLGKIDEQAFRKIIESKNRSEAGFSVPAHGLYLTDVRYPYIP